MKFKLYLQSSVLIFLLIDVCKCNRSDDDDLQESEKHEAGITTEEKLVKLADEAYNQNFYRRASMYYSIAIEKNPSATCYVRRGRCHHKMGNVTKAIEDYRAALAAEEGDNYYQTRRQLLCDALVDAGRYNEAIEESSSLRDAHKIAHLADRLCSLGKFEEALRAYTEAIVRNPDEGHYYAFRGRCYAQQGNLSSALEDYEEAVEKYKNLPDSAKDDYIHAFLNVALFDDKTVEDANREMQALNVSQLITMADELSPENPELSDLYYSEAIKRDATNAEYYEKRGLNYRRMNDLSKAMMDFEEAVKLQPASLNCLIEWGEVLFEVGKIEEAEKVFKNAETNFEDAKNNRRIRAARLMIDIMLEAKAELEKFKNSE